MMWCCVEGRKRERRAGVGTGAVEGSFGERERERGMNVSRANTEDMCVNGTPLGSVKMTSPKLPQVTEFKYLVSTLQSDGDMSTEINKRTQCGWNNWRKMSGIICDKRVYHHMLKEIYTIIL